MQLLHFQSNRIFFPTLISTISQLQKVLARNKKKSALGCRAAWSWLQLEVQIVCTQPKTAWIDASLPPYSRFSNHRLIPCSPIIKSLV